MSNKARWRNFSKEEISEIVKLLILTEKLQES